MKHYLAGHPIPRGYPGRTSFVSGGIGLPDNPFPRQPEQALAVLHDQEADGIIARPVTTQAEGGASQ